VNVAICRYGAGNVRSVELAFRRLGAEVVAADSPADVLDADLAVLPGVGSAASAMAGLRERGLDDALRERAAAGRPVLGICLGLQIALDESEEDGGVAGLALAAGRAVRLRTERVPRIGWATVEPLASPTPALPPSFPARGEAYWFAHSYAAETESATATSEGLVAVVEKGAFTGVQFHPEKSGAAGARFLERCLSRA
jgi:imidazole glycerol phosphate synthase glutamine amidotransferase subunit